MNALERYFDEIEKAPKLASRVGCSHTTLYRIAAGAVRARTRTAAAIERETSGRVTRADLHAIADAVAQEGPAETPEAGGGAGVALGGGNGAEESGEFGRGAAADHGRTLADEAAPHHRESFPSAADGEAQP